MKAPVAASVAVEKLDFSFMARTAGVLSTVLSQASVRERQEHGAIAWLSLTG
jgi:hypothetical protein